MRSFRTASAVIVAAAASYFSALGCSKDDTLPRPAPSTDAGGVGGGGTPITGSPGSIQFTASGEVLALGGYAFPPAGKDDPAFVDGWEVEFSKILVTVDKITLSENADRSPTDQQQTDGVVAEVDGPWAIDLHKGGSLSGKGGTDEQAVAFAELTAQNKAGDKPFDATRRYAFGFEIVAATATAKSVNLDAAAQVDYQEMIAGGMTVLYVGTATFKGVACTPGDDPTLNALPRVVGFRLGFTTPTSYANCQNPDNDPARGFDREEHQRGISIRENAPTVAQLTIHTDHPFWESTEHDSPAHFDQLAALASRRSDAGTAVAMVTLDDLKGVDFTAFKTRSGQSVKWRSCVDSTRYTLPATNPMGFDPKGVPLDPGAAADRALRDYRDYFAYNQSTQGHLNSDGLCFVKRNYPSPP